MTLDIEDLLIMNIKLNHNDRITEKSNSSEQGFSLIETMIALTTLGVCLAYAMPLFLYAKINNSKSEVRAGALFVAQRVFDDIRSKPVSKMPLFDGKKDSNLNCAPAGCVNNTTLPNPEITPNVADITKNTSSITQAEKLLTNAFGRQYQTKVTYCENYSLGSAPDLSICDTKYRKFKVEVSYNGSKVYDLEGTYTDFQ
jgi:prepilin-type N-terminal cleavage/methylation domain-containing protein